jgi:hypothetical protein
MVGPVGSLFKAQREATTTPRAVQDSNGYIFLIGHVGGDDPYGGLEAQNYSGKKPGQTPSANPLPCKSFVLN